MSGGLGYDYGTPTNTVTAAELTIGTRFPQRGRVMEVVEEPEVEGHVAHVTCAREGGEVESITFAAAEPVPTFPITLG